MEFSFIHFYYFSSYFHFVQALYISELILDFKYPLRFVTIFYRLVPEVSLGIPCFRLYLVSFLRLIARIIPETISSGILHTIIFAWIVLLYYHNVLILPRLLLHFLLNFFQYHIIPFIFHTIYSSRYIIMISCSNTPAFNISTCLRFLLF